MAGAIRIQICRRGARPRLFDCIWDASVRARDDAWHARHARVGRVDEARCSAEDVDVDVHVNGPAFREARTRQPSACRAAWSILSDTMAGPFPEAQAVGNWPTPIGAPLGTITNFSLWGTGILMIASRVVHPREKQARSLCWSVGIWAVPVNGICLGHGSPDGLLPAPSRSNDRTGTNSPGPNRPMG
jgi:hypothetical protein